MFNLQIFSTTTKWQVMEIKYCMCYLLLYCTRRLTLTLRLLMSYVYGAPSKARNANVVYIRTYVWQR